MTLTGFETAVSLIDDIAAGRVSAEEALDVLADRLERYNPALNAVVAKRLPMAHHRAKDVDAQVSASRKVGPLAGLQVTVKDMIEVASLPTTCGSLQHMDHIARKDAPAIARLVAAGANVVGKTNAGAYEGATQTINQAFGATKNPWDAKRTPGGTSGGSAAAVAAGLTHLDVASDIAGSLRIPAHFCGVYGHKPSYDIVPNEGLIAHDPAHGRYTDLAVIGPMARGAKDLDLALRIMAGPDDAAARGWRLELPEPRAKRRLDLRVAYWFDDPFLPLERECLHLLDEVIARLAMEGVGKLARAKPDLCLAEVRGAGHVLSQAVIGASLSGGDYLKYDLAARAPAFTAKARAWKRFANSTTASHRDWTQADKTRVELKKACETFFQDFDVLLMPVAPTTAPLRDDAKRLSALPMRINGEEHPGTAMTDWSHLASIAHLPATVAPIGRTKRGLPVGVQIVGRYLDDRTTIAAAQFLSEIGIGFEGPGGK